VLGWFLLRWRRRGVPDPIVLGRYLVGASTLRFVVELIRVNTRIALGLSVAHFISLAVAAVGIAVLVTQQLKHRPASEAESTPKRRARSSSGR
jgi:prolipoprotein diacylglyceryltransferase